MNTTTPLVSCVLLYALTPPAIAEPLKTFSFSEPHWHSRWQLSWNDRLDTTDITRAPDSKQLLQVNYPQGSVGPRHSGVQFPIEFAKLADLKSSYTALRLDYCVTFSNSFDFVLGGKLPGLMGAEDSWSRSGGNQPNGSNGWTMRYMWRENGAAVIYAYLPPSPNGRYGGHPWGQDIELGERFIPGQRHCLAQQIKINDLGQENGELTVWFDGKQVLHRKDITYRLTDTPAGYIGGIMFSTFHGGNTPDWAPAHLSKAWFDALSISNANF
ncbi:polysaccharide lyase [uncultured Gilvimarinus sp.]|uniref:polysaccharide lyase n=1 Tax=uncultured Gilvimarinus sp. TaxID=1689143 RepID=UPI0030EE9456|tara:strand:+ start:198 stop:1007 length:810 start_codon:yes stop_codon:yes gene_type:complete